MENHCCEMEGYISTDRHRDFPADLEEVSCHRNRESVRANEKAS
jgi:hypothetical protein